MTDCVRRRNNGCDNGNLVSQWQYTLVTGWISTLVEINLAIL